MEALLLIAPMWLIGFTLLARVRSPRPGRVEASVSVIIPARDEEKNLPALLESLQRQTPPPAEIIVVDDGSRDGTCAVARRHVGVEVVRATPAPAGWAGKNWACWTGARRARGQVLVFLDADTRLDPGGLSAIAAEQQRLGGLLAVEPHHRAPRAYEQLSALFVLLRAAGTGGFTPWSGQPAPHGAVGPCLAVPREAYLAVGGHAHASVRGQVLESIPLGRVFAERGDRVTCLAGRGVIWTRMYPDGPGQLVEGWSKGFASGAGATPRHLLLLSVAWLAGAVAASTVPAVALLAGAPVGSVALLSLAYAAYALQLIWMLARLGAFWRLTALVYPLALTGFFVIFVRSLLLVKLRGQVSWRGRSIAVLSGSGEA